ncbi:MAG: IS1182 family transposase, partial [Pseudomarimonas sp.]
LAALATRDVDTLIADAQMRQRDERFADQGKHTAKPDPLHDKSGKAKATTVFTAEQFVISDDQS